MIYSHGVQKEILNLMSDQIVKNLLKPGSSCVFSLMRDDYTDFSYKEQLTFCMRWVNNDIKVSEKLLGIYEILDIKTIPIVTVMKDILLRYQLNLDIWKGQCHNDASNMWENHSSLPLIFLQNNQRHIIHTVMLIRYRFQKYH